MARLMNVKSKSTRVSQKCRVVDKSGYPNIQYKNISKRRRKYFSDLFTTLVDSRYLQFMRLNCLLDLKKNVIFSQKLWNSKFANTSIPVHSFWV